MRAAVHESRVRIENLLRQLPLEAAEIDALLLAILARRRGERGRELEHELVSAPAESPAVAAIRARFEAAGHVVLDGWITPQGAQWLCGKSAAAMRADRARGTGAPFRRVGTAVLYRFEEVCAYLLSRGVTDTDPGTMQSSSPTS